MAATEDPIAGNVRAEMARRRLTQTDVALLLGMSQNAVSRRLSGRTPWRLTDLRALADALGTTVSALIEPHDSAGAA